MPRMGCVTILGSNFHFRYVLLIAFKIILSIMAPGLPILADPIPTNTQLFVGDLGGAGSGPIKFTQGTPTSGLSYTFTSLASATDDVSFSNNSGASYVYTPVNTGGFDANVTNISINPKNAFACSTTGSTPTAQLEFDVGIK